MRKYVWPVLLMAGCSRSATSEQPAAPTVAIEPTPVRSPATVDSEAADDVIADKIAATPAKESDGIPRKDDPGYGSIIRLALMKKANARIVPGRSLKLWLADMTREQRLAVELQRLIRNTDDIFRRGWDAEVPSLLVTLTDNIGTPAAKVAANDLERLTRLARPADADGVRTGGLYDSSESSEAMIERCRGRQRKIEDVFDRDVATFLHRLWWQSDQGKSWEDWR